MAQRIYRRLINTYTWHFCENCPGWPDDKYQETTDSVGWGDLCSDCQVLLLKGNCTKSARAEEVV